MKTSYGLTITGRVQGVSFRYHTMEKARELGISGYVKNQRDATVYVEAQGEKSIHGSVCKMVPSGAILCPGGSCGNGKGKGFRLQ